MKTANSEKSILNFLVYFFPIASYLFYQYAGINSVITKAIYFATVPCTLFFVWDEITRNYKNSRYAGVMRAIFLCMIFSFFVSLVVWNQSLILSYRVSASLLAIIYFFILRKAKPTINQIEKLVFIFCAIYILCWLYGISQAPNVVFGGGEERGINDERGIYRLYVPGKGILILTLFLTLNKFILTNKYLWLFAAVVLFGIIVLHVIRQVIAFSFLVSSYYFLKNAKYKIMWAAASAIIAVFILTMNINDDSVVGNLLSKTERQVSNQQSGEDDIRVREYKYFFTEYSDNLFTQLFGNGKAHSFSPLGKMETEVQVRKKYFASDVGYAAIYIRLGLIGLVLYAILFFKVFTQKVPVRFKFAQLHIVYMLFANIAASWIFHDVIIICISVYVLEMVQKDRKKAGIIKHFVPERPYLIKKLKTLYI